MVRQCLTEVSREAAMEFLLSVLCDQTECWCSSVWPWLREPGCCAVPAAGVTCQERSCICTRGRSCCRRASSPDVDWDRSWLEVSCDVQLVGWDSTAGKRKMSAWILWCWQSGCDDFSPPAATAASALPSSLHSHTGESRLCDATPSWPTAAELSGTLLSFLHLSFCLEHPSWHTSPVSVVHLDSVAFPAPFPSAGWRMGTKGRSCQVFIFISAPWLSFGGQEYSALNRWPWFWFYLIFHLFAIPGNTLCASFPIYSVWPLEQLENVTKLICLLSPSSIIKANHETPPDAILVQLSCRGSWHTLPYLFCSFYFIWDFGLFSFFFFLSEETISIPFSPVCSFPVHSQNWFSGS